MDLGFYTSLRYQRRIIGNRVIIADVPLTGATREKLESLHTVDGHGMCVLHDIELGEMLDVLLKEYIGGSDSIVVFPGSGARYPRRCSALLRMCQGIEVPAGRIWVPGSEPRALAGTIAPDRFLVLGIRRIIVVDDVISSGATMRALHKRNAWRFPNASWVAGTWMLQHPQSRCRSGIAGFDTVLGGCVVSKPDGSRAAVNSLSTLCFDAAVRASYAERHIAPEDREEFDRVLQTLGAP
jgi:hypothetical protein